MRWLLGACLVPVGLGLVAALRKNLGRRGRCLGFGEDAEKDPLEARDGVWSRLSSKRTKVWSLGALCAGGTERDAREKTTIGNIACV